MYHSFFHISVSALVSVRSQAAQLSSLSSQGLVALVNVYVLVTSATPLTAFLHCTGLVRTHLDKHSYITKVMYLLTCLACHPATFYHIECHSMPYLDTFVTLCYELS